MSDFSLVYIKKLRENFRVRENGKKRDLNREKVKNYMKLENKFFFFENFSDSEDLSVDSDKYVQEKVLKEILDYSPRGNIEERIDKYILKLKKYPVSLQSVVQLFLGKNSTSDFIIEALKDGENIIPWEEYICANLNQISDEKLDPIRIIDLNKTVQLVFKEDGLLKDIIKDYEYRHEQFMTTLEIVESIKEENGMIVEAGTGTGKSLAYLVPLAYYTMSSDKKAVISTKTKILQDQLLDKDVKILRKLPSLTQLRVSVIKGRESYFCLENFFDFLDMVVDENPELLQSTDFLKILLWSMRTTTGDLDEINTSLKKFFKSNRYECKGMFCIYNKKCPYFVARENAKKSHVVITNHALLFSEAEIRMTDEMAEGKDEDNTNDGILIPKFDVLVLDEAHEVENSLTDAMSFSFIPSENMKTIRELINKSFEIINKIKIKYHEDFIKNLKKTISDDYKNLFKALKEITEKFNGVNFKEKNLNESEIETLMSELQSVESYLRNFKGISIQISGMLDDFMQEETEKYNQIFQDHRKVINMLDEQLKNVCGITAFSDVHITYFDRIQRDGKRYLIILSSPVAHEKIMKKIFPDVKTKIFISATMWVFSKGSDGFNYSRRILGLGEDFRAIKLGSSFDYRNQLKFYVVEDMIEYSHNNLEYLKEGAEVIQNIIKIGKGGILTLFTSYRDMEYVKNVVHSENINLKVQEKLLSQTKLIEEHIKQKDSILFGNRTFWEGIDLPGEHLKILVIFKLPFERPDDPIIESRINHFGEKSFHEGLYKYYYPKMITNLRQGIGRLIRTKSDRGIVIILDNRVVDRNRNYSNKILRSMPPGIEAVSILKKNLLRTMKALKKEGFI